MVVCFAKMPYLIFARQKGACMKLIERPLFLERLKCLVGAPNLKVITGAHRAGKSKLLEAFKSYLLAEVLGTNVIHVNFNLPEFESLLKYHALHDYVCARHTDGVPKKHGIRNERLHERLVDYMADNMSNVTSAHSVTNALTSAGTVSDDRTISAHMSHLEETLAFYRIRHYDIRGKRYLSSGDKHYLVDHAFCYAKLGTRNMDFGRVLENVVAIELLRRGYETYAGILYEREIDFVAMRGGEKLYIQVSDDISSPETFRREYSPLLSIRDAHPKMILARTRHETYSYEGIEVHDLARWLANRGGTADEALGLDPAVRGRGHARLDRWPPRVRPGPLGDCVSRNDATPAREGRPSQRRDVPHEGGATGTSWGRWATRATRCYSYQQCTQMARNDVERPFSLICVHSCVPKMTASPRTPSTSPRSLTPCPTRCPRHARAPAAAARRCCHGRSPQRSSRYVAR